MMAHRGEVIGGVVRGGEHELSPDFRHASDRTLDRLMHGLGGGCGGRAQDLHLFILLGRSG